MKCEQGLPPGRETLRLALAEIFSADKYEDILQLFNGFYDDKAATGNGPGAGSQFEKVLLDDCEPLRFLCSEYRIRTSLRSQMDIVDLTTSVATDKLLCFGYAQLMAASQPQRANRLLEDACAALLERIGTARTQVGSQSRTAQSLEVLKLLARKAFYARPTEGAKEQQQWCNALAGRLGA